MSLQVLIQVTLELTPALPQLMDKIPPQAILMPSLSLVNGLLIGFLKHFF